MRRNHNSIDHYNYKCINYYNLCYYKKSPNNNWTHICLKFESFELSINTRLKYLLHLFYGYLYVITYKYHK